MKRQPIFIGLLLLLVSLACVFGGRPATPVGEVTVEVRRPTATPEGPEEPAGRLTPEEELVEVGAALDALQQLLDPAPFFNGDVLRVTNGGQVLMEIGDELWLRLFNDTQMDVVSVEAAENTPLDVQLFLADGGFTGQLTAEGGQAQFETPNGVKVTIVGTTFFVGYDPATSDTIVINFEGNINIDDGAGGSFVLTANNMVQVPSGTPEPFRPITLREFETAVRRSDSPVETAGQLACPPIYNPSLTIIKTEGGFDLEWESAGGCGPYNGILTAMYEGEDEPFATFSISEPDGRLFVETPLRCEGTYIVVFNLSLVDSLGREVEAGGSREVFFLC